MATKTREISTEKIPPQDIEAEICVLGSMLIEESALSSVIDLLDENTFYKDVHKKIFASIVDLYSSSRNVDVVTVSEDLRKKGELENIGGPSYITSLTNSIPTAANAIHYARIIKEKALLRNLITTSTQIVSEGYAASADVDELIDKAERSIFELATKKIEAGFIAMKELVRDAIEMIDTLYQKKGFITGIPTGYEDLDRLTCGLQRSDLIIIAGRPSMGKSALGLCIAEHVGITHKIPVALFSLEMSKEHLVQRMMCSHARVNGQNVRAGFLATADWPKLTNAAGKLSESPIYVDDTPGISLLELRAKARRMKSQYDIGLIILDYLQLIQGPKTENRQQEISEISRSLKALARELNVPLIAISQLSRAPERREDYRPRLSDLRESGAIEQDADLVVLLFREEYYNPQDESIRGLAEAIVAKQRNGPVGTVKLTFINDYARFENIASGEAT
ncbi:MAG: replicative DNA helicase [Candidatus Omnitrophota bacterium]